MAVPDSLVGTDSHTTMINGLGVVGWGVGGIEAEAVMLGQPIYMLMPDVVGFELTGQLAPGVTATDAVLTITQILRRAGVVGKFVEFYGGGVDAMSLADRATIANMAPEYGATMGFFPVDDETLELPAAHRARPDDVDLVERYMKEQGLYRTPGSPCPDLHQDVVARSGDGRAVPGGPEAPAGSRGRWRSLKKSFRDGADGAGGGTRIRPHRRRPAAASDRARPGGQWPDWATARWSSRPSPVARTPAIPRSCWRPGCWPRRPWPKACACLRT